MVFTVVWHRDMYCRKASKSKHERHYVQQLVLLNKKSNTRSKCAGLLGVLGAHSNLTAGWTFFCNSTVCSRIFNVSSSDPDYDWVVMDGESCFMLVLTGGVTCFFFFSITMDNLQEENLALNQQLEVQIETLRQQLTEQGVQNETLR